MERGPAEETPPMEPGRLGRQRAPDCIRRQKRRELDARRSKCRIRIGGHLERWCRLKEQLGFALHSQLAQFLLDRYSSHSCIWSPGEPEPNLLHADALQRLVVLSHGHGQECGFIPDVKPPAPGSTSQLVWECVAGHSFSWGVPGAAGDCTPTTGHHGEEQQGDSGCSSPLATGGRRSLRQAGLAAESGSGKREAEPEGAAQLPVGDGNRTEEPGARCDDSDDGNAAPQVPTETGTVAKDHGSALVPEEKAEQRAEHQEEEEEEEDEDFAEDDDLAYTDDLRDENYHPSLDSDSELQRRQSQTKARKKSVKEEQPPNEPNLTNSSPSEEKGGRVNCKRRAQPCDEDVAQIGPKRIRKAAKREILLCDFEGCGKIFSNRQYLNHHKKYQHVHQKTFTCSEPSCGKSFNFKKHLKEHEKLHSDKRDYICEFCARSFRTSSNLIIHRRIHTGEKPLQCEICGFTCRQKASLNWHMKKHDADSFYQFSCDICGKKFEKKDNVTAHKSKSHPEVPSGPPQAEGGQRQMVPSPPPNFRAGMQAGLEHPEVPGTLAVEPLEMPGLGDTLVSGGELEKTPPPIAASAEYSRQDPGVPRGQVMDSVGS
ncbi:zinc finger protein 692-like isoform X1 [Accipiter gentilis]|uniref:zinc finger protein 692-like isoform X1 n=2 Tax=Astur gentilis TaxID=8957 RepID=UPI002110ABC5|nr:zinc finger protein 692-like isoform X1 [Accipiter gentilis]